MMVLILPEVRQYFYELSHILYEKDYFSFMETSERYVEELVNDIKKKLPTKRHRPAPKHYDKYGKGMYYAAFTKNKRTTWYAFFTKYAEKGETIYLVRYIGNNHTEAHHLYDGVYE